MVQNHTEAKFSHGICPTCVKKLYPDLILGKMNDSHDMYLCQMSETVSCGACCGLYNLPNLSREKLEDLLSKRTKAFASVPRTEDGIYKFKRKNRGPHRLSRPFPGFHHCPFLGLIGGEKSRVGCLLHPTVPVKEVELRLGRSIMVNALKIVHQDRLSFVKPRIFRHPPTRRSSGSWTPAFHPQKRLRRQSSYWTICF